MDGPRVKPEDVPSIHAFLFLAGQDVDARDKRGHDALKLRKGSQIISSAGD